MVKNNPDLTVDMLAIQLLDRRNDTKQEAPVNYEPTPDDLAAIEAEWPLIAAELDLVSAECRLAHAPTDVLAIRAHRRAVRAVLTALAEQTTRPEPNRDAAPLALVPAPNPTHLVSGTAPVAA
jgi:hypothetical protein